jgi:hypothetical protein
LNTFKQQVKNVHVDKKNKPKCSLFDYQKKKIVFNQFKDFGTYVQVNKPNKQEPIFYLKFWPFSKACHETRKTDNRNRLILFEMHFILKFEKNTTKEDTRRCIYSPISISDNEDKKTLSIANSLNDKVVGKSDFQTPECRKSVQFESIDRPVNIASYFNSWNLCKKSVHYEKSKDISLKKTDNNGDSLNKIISVAVDDTVIKLESSKDPKQFTTSELNTLRNNSTSSNQLVIPASSACSSSRFLDPKYKIPKISK